MPTVAEPIETLAQELRVRLGWPDDEEETDAELRRMLESALRELNGDRPLVKLASFSTVAEQPNYDVVPDEAYEVQEVFYYPGAAGAADDPFRVMSLNNVFGYDLLAGGVGGGARLFDNPSLVIGFFKKMESFRSMFGGRMSREIDDGTIWLEPTPCGACTVFFTYTAPRFASVNLVQRPWESPLLLRAEAFALEAMAHKRSHLVSHSVPGSSFTTGGGRVQVEMAKQKLAEYQTWIREAPVGSFFS